MSEDKDSAGGTPDDIGQPNRAAKLNPPPRRRPTLPVAHADPDISPTPVEQVNGERGYAAQAKPSKRREKRQPTGDYPVGYARPPVEHQFKGKAGPGRPKGAVSHDTLLRRDFERKKTLKINGKAMKMSMREIHIMARSNGAARGEPGHSKAALAESARLYPEPQDKQPGAGVASPLGDGTMDGQVLRELLGILSLGERNPEIADPWQDMAAAAALDESRKPASGAWAEGDWEAPPTDQSDIEENPDAQD